LKSLGKVIDEEKLAPHLTFFTDIGCNLLAWDFFDLPTAQTHHGRTVPTAVGFKMAQPTKVVACLIGDGGGYAIGLQNLIHACLRNSPVTVILANNTNYGMTGGQLSPTSTTHQVTDSTPFGRNENLDGKTFWGPEFLRTLAWPKAYLARASSHAPRVVGHCLRRALETQKAGHFSLIEIISACPLNWKTDAAQTIARVKALEKIFTLGEF
jgi:2-oxoglutarate ferredoxin oxidoreductase subunit beta